VPILFDDSYEPVIGRAETVRQGNDVTLIGTGVLLGRCLKAAEALAAEGIEARVLDLHTVKPLDGDAVLRAARETGGIVTAEEHTIIGGLGSAVAELICENGVAVPVQRVGIHDEFAESGTHAELLDKYGMSVAAVASAARRALQLRGTSAAHELAVKELTVNARTPEAPSAPLATPPG
jgi:transketolase